jgi:4-hydroxy-tetrahydrodipicolinate synthase
MKSNFYGVITPLITPFSEDYSIDEEGLRWLVRYLIKKRVHGVFPNSTTGEFVHLTKEEALRITEITLEESGGNIWVIPGISSNYTEHCIELGRAFKDLGVDGVIVTPPYFFKIDHERLKIHFSKILEKIDLPVIIYNIPSATGINISISLYKELSKEYNNLAGAKVTYENFIYLRQLIQMVKSERRDFAVLTGLDEMFLPLLMLGGDGGIMALANVFPEIHRAIYDSYMSGDLLKALEEWRKLLKLVRIYDYTSSYPTAIKSLLYVIGAPIKPIARPPLEMERSDIIKKIEDIVKEMNMTQFSY